MHRLVSRLLLVWFRQIWALLLFLLAWQAWLLLAQAQAQAQVLALVPMLLQV
jgi:hypothetical protein